MEQFDRKTGLLLALHVVLVLGNFVLAASGVVPLWAAFLVGLCAFNLSFTLWHECVHGTIAKDADVCSRLGRIVNFLLLYPGYGAQRREHLLHHKYQGDPEKDPVFPRVQCPPWLFPMQLVRVTLFDPLPRYPERRLTAAERRDDGLQYGAALTLAALFCFFGWGPAFFAAWVLPRLVIFPIHAFYVCYIPHADGGKKLYQTYRIVLRNPFTRYLTLYHSYHGLHHVWPTIPWYKYQSVFRARRAELEARGVEILT